MTKVLGIDPGQNTGMALYSENTIIELFTIQPIGLLDVIYQYEPEIVIYEDSRLQSHVWTGPMPKAAAMKVARNLGQIDAWCSLIVEICAKRHIPCRGISPKDKGAKVDSKRFKEVTGWIGKSNQHERDAAMVAWPFTARFTR